MPWNVIQANPRDTWNLSTFNVNRSTFTISPPQRGNTYQRRATPWNVFIPNGCALQGQHHINRLTHTVHQIQRCTTLKMLNIRPGKCVSYDVPFAGIRIQ